MRTWSPVEPFRQNLYGGERGRNGSIFRERINGCTRSRLAIRIGGFLFLPAGQTRAVAAGGWDVCGVRFGSLERPGRI